MRVSGKKKYIEFKQGTQNNIDQPRSKTNILQQISKVKVKVQQQPPPTPPQPHLTQRHAHGNSTIHMLLSSYIYKLIEPILRSQIIDRVQQLLYLRLSFRGLQLCRRLLPLGTMHKHNIQLKTNRDQDAGDSDFKIWNKQLQNKLFSIKKLLLLSTIITEESDW